MNAHPDVESGIWPKSKDYCFKKFDIDNNNNNNDNGNNNNNNHSNNIDNNSNKEKLVWQRCLFLKNKT